MYFISVKISSRKTKDGKWKSDFVLFDHPGSETIATNFSFDTNEVFNTKNEADQYAKSSAEKLIHTRYPKGTKYKIDI